MSITASAVLRRGARVRFIGIPHPRVQFGAEGLVTGQDRDRWVVDFPVGAPDHTERVTLHRVELEVLDPDDMKGRISQRISELNGKGNPSKADIEELKMLLNRGPAARRVARSDEVPF